MRTRVLALVLASASFAQQALSAPADIFESAAPVIGSDPPKARDINDGDASVSTQTGALQYSYPIHVPPGRNGMAPTLNLSYSSQAPIYGGIAAGWSLSIPEVREDTSQGRLATHSSWYEDQQANQGIDPRLDDRFISSLAGGRPLVRVTEPIDTDVFAAYRAQNDGSFARYERMATGQPFSWRVRQTDGSIMLFGETALAGGCAVSEGYAPLTTIIDQFGNAVSYRWESQVTNECRIKEITWGQNSSAGIPDSFAKVSFEYLPGTRCITGDEAQYVGGALDYRSGRKTLTGASRLVGIRATAFPYGGQNAPTHTRLITLAYSPTSENCFAAHSPVRLLSSIQESAWGNGLPQVNLPAVTFEYGSAVINQNSQSTPAAPPTWSDAMGQPPRRNNLGWGKRAPNNAPDKWPTVEAMMLDVDGDGLLDRVVNSSSGGDCTAHWQRNMGPSATSSMPGFEGERLISLPRLRWKNDATPDPSEYEGCALNGQVTAYRNIASNMQVPCHDGMPGTSGPICQFSTTPGLTNEKFCYWAGEFGLQCPSSGNAPGGSYRTYLAYRWLDVDADGLPDLVTAIHGNIKAMDIIEGTDGSPPASPPFGPWPTCPTQFDRCKAIDRFCIDHASTEAEANRCVTTAPSKPCSALTVTPYAAPGTPPKAPYLREPYTRCEGLYPWFIYRNQGNGVLATSAIIKYSPVPLESENGDSALTGPSISSQDHGIFDFDGDGRLDAVKVNVDGNNWQVWRGDGTGGFESKVHVVKRMTSPYQSVSAIGESSNYATFMASAQGVFDLNADGLPDRWYRLPGGNASIAWNNGTGFDTVVVPGSSPLAYTGTVTTGTNPLKPASDARFVCNPVPAPNQPVEGADSYAANRVVDADNDGRQDIVRINSSFSTLDVFFNTGALFLTAGHGWAGDGNGLIRHTVATPESVDSARPWEVVSDLIDLDGDGILESAFFPNWTNLDRREHVTNGAPPRLMTSVNNGRGTTTTILYASMHDQSTVVQSPTSSWFDGRRKVSPHNQWVVKTLSTTDAFSSPLAMTTTQKYFNPRHGADDEGRFAFRGFEEVRTTTPSNSQLVERWDYQEDWSGRQVESRVHPAPTSDPSVAEVRTIDRTTWKARTLFNGAVTTYHVGSREHFTCANGQTPATCTAAAAPAYTKTLVSQESFAGGGGTPALWQDTESVLQAGATLANGDRRTVDTFFLKSETNLYRFRPLTSTREHRVTGAWTVFDKTASTWDSEWKLKQTDEQWFNTVDADRAITRFVYDPDTGNVLERWKPVQNAANTTRTVYTYDAKKLFVATETNELGHVRSFTYEPGTGTKTITSGPNVSTCGGVCPPNAPPGSICLATEQYETKIDGLGRPIEQWDTVSDDGCTLFYYQRSTTSYVDAVVVPSTPSSVTEQTRIDSNAPTWTQKRTDLDGLGRPTKETVFVQGSAPADQITVFNYSTAGTLTSVEVPNPSVNTSARVSYVYTYDTLKRPLTIRRPDSTTSPSGTNIDYNGVTKTVTEVVGAGGGTPAATKTIDDRFGRLSQVQEQTGTSTWQTTTYTYGPDDLVATITDPESVLTTLTHDFGGRRTQIARGTRLWKYAYSKNGNLQSEQVPGSDGTPAGDLAHTTTIAYDDLDRPLQKSVGQRNLSTADQDLFGGAFENFYYDITGNMLGKLYAWELWAPGPTGLRVTDISRFTTQNQRYSTAHGLTIAGYAPLVRNFYQNFYLFGGVRGTTYYDEVSGTSQHTESVVLYDARALPSSIQVTTGPTTNTSVGVQTRNVAGLVTKRRSTLVAGGANWVESNWTYDKLGRVGDQTVQKGPTISAVARQTLQYNGNDDPKQMTHYLGSASKIFNYTYDRRHQLLTAAATTSSYFSGTYTYGNAGRLTRANESQTSPPSNGTSEVKPRNVNYVYSGTDPEQVTALTNVSGGATYASFTYDAAGNMTAKCTGGQVATCTGANVEKLEYVYDGSDQLRRVTRKLNGAVTGSEEYWYGNGGNRIAIVKRDAGGAKTDMIWFIGDAQAHYNASGAVTHVYSHVSLGTPVARIDRTADTVASTEYQFHGLASSTLATVGSDGSITSSFRYSPWGAVVEASSGSTTTHRRRHNDKYVDEVSNLHSYGARYYDKVLIGWTQSDPLYRFAPEAAWRNPRKARLYTYTENNALRYIDPDGRSSTVVAGAESGAAIGGALGGPVGAVLGALAGAAIGGVVAKVAGPDAMSPCVGVACAVTSQLADAASQVPAGTPPLIAGGAAWLAATLPLPVLMGDKKRVTPPSWVAGSRPAPGETAQDFATRVLNDKYGDGGWNKGPGSEFNQIVKWVHRVLGAGGGAVLATDSEEPDEKEDQSHKPADLNRDGQVIDDEVESWMRSIQ